MDPRDKPVSDKGRSCWGTAITALSLVIHGLVPWIHVSGKRDLSNSNEIGVQFSGQSQKRLRRIALDEPAAGSTGQPWA